MMLRPVVLVGLALAVPSPTAAADPSGTWGGGRMFFQGHEIVPPIEFSGLGLSTLFANGVRVDPLPCESSPEPDPFRQWCGTTDGSPENPWSRRLAQQELAIDRILALSRLPLVMIGCDYFYRPGAEEADRVLQAIDGGDPEAMVESGAPAEVVRDLRVAREEARR